METKSEKEPQNAMAGDIWHRVYPGCVITMICCGERLWTQEGDSYEIKQPKVSKRAIAAAARADRKWKERGERAPSSVTRSRRGGRGGYTSSGHWTGD